MEKCVNVRRGNGQGNKDKEEEWTPTLFVTDSLSGQLNVSNLIDNEGLTVETQPGFHLLPPFTYLNTKTRLLNVPFLFFNREAHNQQKHIMR